MSGSGVREKYLVTSALPYANGPIHFGHIAGAYLPADIFVRYKRLTGAEVLFVCGTDEHGVAVTITAEKAGVTPREHVDKWHAAIRSFFERMRIEFDNFSRTTLPLHYDLSSRFFLRLLERGLVTPMEEEQFHCATCGRFLADRYLTGICPKCGADGARGDECPACGSWLDAKEIRSPRCMVCGREPRLVSTRHWYLRLDELRGELEKWLDTKRGWWKKNVMTMVDGMLKAGLKPRPITRDLDWGVPVPLEEARGKVLYVWFDAPIGYISSTMEWARKSGRPQAWEEWWKDPRCRLVHFIGKDNIPFHTIVWPAMLMGVDEGYVLPHDVPANEFFNYEGRKFNTSSGWYIDVEDFFSRYPVDAARYYIARNAPENSDSEFRWKEFQSRFNDELADVYGNLANRVLRFISRYFDGRTPPPVSPDALDPLSREAREKVAHALEVTAESLDHYRVRKGVVDMMEIARIGNRYFDESRPWETRKSDPDACARTMDTCLWILDRLSVASSPFIPEAAGKLAAMLGAPSPGSRKWGELANPVRTPFSERLGKVEILFGKIDDEAVEAELRRLEAVSAAEGRAEASAAEDARKVEPLEKEFVDPETFFSVDMRVGEVKEAEKIPRSRKLLRLKVDFGVERRTILAGLAPWYEPEWFIGKRFVFVVNLPPRKMMGEESQGMLLAAGDRDGKPVPVTVCAADVPPGARLS